MNNFYNQKLWGLTKRRDFKWWEVTVRESDVQDSVNIVINHASSEHAKVVTTIDRVNVGKNIGKANETSVIEQAVFQAQSKVNKQLDKGYATSKDFINPDVGLLNTLRHPRPMLAEPLAKLRTSDIKGQMYVQRGC